MPWPRPAQRVLLVAAAILFLFAIAQARRAEREAASFVPIAADPRLDLRIDLNRAAAVELEALPGIGPALAAAIVSHRDRHGPFRTIEELRGVNGLSAKLVGSLEPYLSVR